RVGRRHAAAVDLVEHVATERVHGVVRDERSLLRDPTGEVARRATVIDDRTNLARVTRATRIALGGEIVWTGHHAGVAHVIHTGARDLARSEEQRDDRSSKEHLTWARDDRPGPTSCAAPNDRP